MVAFYHTPDTEGPGKPKIFHILSSAKIVSSRAVNHEGQCGWFAFERNFLPEQRVIILLSIAVFSCIK